MPSEVNLNSQGFLAGGQIGYNYRFHEKGVAGLEVDLQGLTVGNSTLNSWQGPASAFTFLQVQRNQHSLGTVRGRIGYLVTPTTLVYGTGGLAFGEAILNASYFSPLLRPVLNFGVGPNGLSGYVDMRLGWAAGAGGNGLTTRNGASRANISITIWAPPIRPMSGPWTNASAAGVSSTGYSSPFNGNIVRAGVNYHLNLGAASPVVAGF